MVVLDCLVNGKLGKNLKINECNKFRCVVGAVTTGFKLWLD